MKLATSIMKPGVERSGHAPILLMSDDSHSVVGPRVPTGNLKAIVRTCVVNNDDLNVPMRLIEAALNGLAEISGALVARNDDGNEGGTGVRG
jgi:hypothetical protein